MRSAALLLAVLATPAAAFEPTGNVVADAFLATLERGGYTDVAAASVSRAEGAVVIDRVSAAAATDVGQTLAVDTIRIRGGAVNADNALVAEEITYSDVRVTEADGSTTSTIGSVAIVAPAFPTGDSDPVTGVGTLFGAFETVRMEEIVASAPDGTSIEVGAIAATVEERDFETAAAGSFSVEDLVFDVSTWEEPAESQMRALGYERLTLDLVGRGRWEAATGRAVVEGLRVSAEDVGALTVDANLDGLTAATLTELQAGVSDFAQTLTLLQNVTLSGLTVRYSDDGLTQRLLADTAKRANVPPEALVDGLVATIPDALSILNAPGFTEMVASAARTFLDAPGTLTVAAAPAAPVTFAEVLGSALMNPGAIPAILNLEITAAP